MDSYCPVCGNPTPMNELETLGGRCLNCHAEQNIKGFRKYGKRTKHGLYIRAFEQQLGWFGKYPDKRCRPQKIAMSLAREAYNRLRVVYEPEELFGANRIMRVVVESREAPYQYIEKEDEYD